jgi:diadenosine tetraphosphatase ApaH/serine/threonine PP2A family protein phosphatase
MQKVSGSVAIEKAHPQIDDTGITQMIVESKYVYNVGSVGEPLNGTDATYLIMDLNTGEAEIVHVAFDIDETIRRMHKAKVPDYVIDRFQENDEITRKDRLKSC